MISGLQSILTEGSKADQKATNKAFILLCMSYFLITSLGEVTSANAETLFPVRPTLRAHQKCLAGDERTTYQRYALSRVGHCTSNKQSEASSPFSYALQAQRHLNCDQGEHLKEVADTSKYINRSVSSRKKLSKGFAQSFADSAQHTRWRIAVGASDHLLAHQLSTSLTHAPYPKRSRERFKLSESLELLKALEFGPVQSNVSPGQAINSLRTLSREALGVQVRASALYSLSFWGESDTERAQAELELWTSYPQTPYADQVSLSNEPVRDWLARGEAAFKARDYKRTIEALQRFSPLDTKIHFISGQEDRSAIKELGTHDLTSAASQRSGLLIAISLMRLREYPNEAERQLEVALHGPDSSTSASALFYQTHLFSRLGRWDESLSKLADYLKTKPRGRRGREARYQLGRIKHQAGRYIEAAEELQQFISQRPKDPVMYEWFLGWSYFRNGDCPKAIKVWRSLKKNKNLVIGPKARYWTARCHAMGGNKRRAIRELKSQLSFSPLGYYALLAQSFMARLEERPFKWQNPIRKQRARHWRIAAPPLPTRSVAQLKRSKYTRELANDVETAFGLVSLGEEGLARVITRSICKDRSSTKAIKRKLGAKSLWRLCDSLEYYTGDHGARWKRQSPKRVAWKVGFHRRSIKERVEAYPIAYYDLSIAAAELEEITPWWLMSHMLQESRYRPEVVSYAQAIGLLQILGRTGKRIQQAIQWPRGQFFSDLLYDPAISIRYAAWYLHHLSEDLGHPLLAIGAYNGGPMRFADHQDAFKDQPFDLMVEEMGAHESRNYLRKVADHFVRYLALYATDKEWERWTLALAPPEMTPVPKRTVGF